MHPIKGVYEEEKDGFNLFLYVYHFLFHNIFLQFSNLHYKPKLKSMKSPEKTVSRIKFSNSHTYHSSIVLSSSSSSSLYTVSHKKRQITINV